MKIEANHLRQRICTLTTGDLRRIVNSSGEYTSLAVELAQQELSSRASLPDNDRNGIDDYVGVESRDSSRSLRAVLAAGLWFAFCIATLYAVGTAIATLVMIGLLLTSILSLRDIALTLTQTVAIFTVSIWTASTIRAERAYGRAMVLTIIAATAIYQVMFAVLLWHITQETLLLLGFLIFAFWYFAFNAQVNRYYHQPATPQRRGDHVQLQANEIR